MIVLNYQESLPRLSGWGKCAGKARRPSRPGVTRHDDNTDGHPWEEWVGCTKAKFVRQVRRPRRQAMTNVDHAGRSSRQNLGKASALFTVGVMSSIGEEPDTGTPSDLAWAPNRNVVPKNKEQRSIAYNSFRKENHCSRWGCPASKRDDEARRLSEV